MASTTIRDALAWGASKLVSDDGRGEAEILLAHALDADRSVVYAWPERTLTEEQSATFEELVARRASGWPVAYLLGHREFHGLSLLVTPDVLIPRHDTELLVELALARLPPDAPARVADLGTGSGAIALAIASARPRVEVVAVERCESALVVAAMNARMLELHNVAFRHGDWFDPLAGERFALVASNPPYIAERDRHLGEGDLVHEPRAALAAGADGLDAIRAIVAGAPAHLERGGSLLIEHGAEQGAAVRALFERAAFVAVATMRDLEGRERVTLGVAPS
jgi:release factor glutamine methyltransferase